MSRLEQWAVVRAQISPYMAPEQPLQCLQGILSDHGRMPDGSDVTTSPIIGKRLVDLGIGEQRYVVVTRSGTEYLLGAIDPLYEDIFPDAEVRLFKSLPEV